MIWFILSLLLGSPVTCNSTIFGEDGDVLAGKTARYLRRPVDPDRDLIIAHRSLPLGSLVLLHMRASGTWAVGVVGDRGPYGRILAGGDDCPGHGRVLPDGSCWVNGAIEYRKCRDDHPRRKHWKDPRCYSRGSRWNGCVDVAPALAKLLRHDGWERVTVWPIRGLYIDRRTLLRMWGGLLEAKRRAPGATETPPREAMRDNVAPASYARRYQVGPTWARTGAMPTRGTNRRDRGTDASPRTASTVTRSRGRGRLTFRSASGSTLRRRGVRCCRYSSGRRRTSFSRGLSSTAARASRWSSSAASRSPLPTQGDVILRQAKGATRA